MFLAHHGHLPLGLHHMGLRQKAWALEAQRQHFMARKHCLISFTKDLNKFSLCHEKELTKSPSQDRLPTCAKNLGMVAWSLLLSLFSSSDLPPRFRGLVFCPRQERGKKERGVNKKRHSCPQNVRLTSWCSGRPRHQSQPPPRSRSPR